MPQMIKVDGKFVPTELVNGKWTPIEGASLRLETDGTTSVVVNGEQVDSQEPAEVLEEDGENDDEQDEEDLEDDDEGSTEEGQE